MKERVLDTMRTIRDSMNLKPARAMGTIPHVYNVTMRDGVNL